MYKVFVDMLHRVWVFIELFIHLFIEMIQNSLLGNFFNAKSCFTSSTIGQNAILSGKVPIKSSAFYNRDELFNRNWERLIEEVGSYT